MKAILQLIAFIVSVQVGIAQTDANHELQRVAAMSAALDNGGITELLRQAKEKTWKAPHIPSRWHVEHVSKPEQKSADIAARDFGKNLAERLDEEASKTQQLPASDLLYIETSQLIDLSNWCAATEGYGNIYLAQRSLDL